VCIIGVPREGLNGCCNAIKSRRIRWERQVARRGLLIFGFLTKLFELHGMTIVNDKLEGIWNEAVLAYYKVPSQYLS
jgi:hypothetical protein